MSSDVRSSPAASPSLATSTSRTNGTRPGVTGHDVPSSTGRVMALLIIVLGVGLASVWSLVALRQLSSSIVRESSSHLDRARRTFELTRTRTLDSLRAQARVMVEDPRLK